MFGKSRFLSVSIVVALCSGVFLGCPQKPDYQVALLVEPTQLEFGSTEATLEFQVRKSWSSRPMSPMSLQTNQEWLEATSDKTVSNGPDDPITVSVTVDRLLMSAGENEGAVTVVSEGAIHKKVKITAKALLVSDFRSDTTFAYVGDSVQFLDESICPLGEGPILRWMWDFGDGETSTEQNPAHIYANPGVYTVTLTVETASASVKQEKEDYITVAGKKAPEADFEASSRSVLVDEAIQFTDLSTAGTAAITRWLWNFGDGQTSSEQNPAHSYDAPGVYGVSLTVVSAHGSDTQLVQGYVSVETVEPSADFAADSRTPLLGRTVQFTDRSSPGTAPITSWFWEFGDGATSTLQHPTHAYSAAGAYAVRLTVVTADGSNTEEKPNYIQVRLSGPSADFTADEQTVFTGETVRFVDLSEPGTAPITGWLWEFGDGGTSSAQNPQHVYTSAGEYTVTLTIVTSHGSDSVTKTDYITVIARTGPTASFTASTQAPAIGDAVQFMDTSDPGTAPITSWLWNFGDGGTSALRNPSHTYTTIGVYTVSLTVTTAHGTDTYEVPDFLSVLPQQGPTADFIVSTVTPFATDTVQFTDTSDPGTAPISIWQWTFGDGGTSTAQNPSHVYTTPGTYSVSLTVTTAHGSDSITRTNLITVSPTTLPIANFSVSNRNPENGEAVQFTDESSSGTAPITNWIWNFGDGTTSNERNPVHLYTEAGTFTVSLTVSSAHGSDTLSIDNYIVVWESGGPEPPTAEFTSDLIIVRVGEPVQFTDLSDPGSSPIDSWLWYFGDEGTSTEQHPSYAYTATGVYPVRLTVVTADGADTEVKLLYIRVVIDPVGPVADFEVDNANPIVGEQVQFTDTSLPGTSVIVGWLWDFGDGTTSTEQNPAHTYNEAVVVSTSYTVTLTIFAEDSQSDSVTSTVTVWNPSEIEPPDAALMAINTIPSTGEDVQFLDTSDPGTAPITSWLWDFGDGFTSSDRDPVHAYSRAGLYSVSLTVQSAHGEDSVTRTDYIAVQGTVAPAADFTVSLRNPNVSDEIQFTDLSEPGTAPITSWSWNFGDGQISTAQHPAHTYAWVGLYTVRLTVTTAHGTDTEVKERYISVYGAGSDGPTADFAASPTTLYVGEQVVFTDLSTPGDAPITEYLWEFGDGQQSTSPTPVHTYTFAGTYTVALTVTTALGSDTETKVDYITAEQYIPGEGPAADFTVDDRNPKVGETVTFTDASDPGDAGEITSWTWDFGDGSPQGTGSTVGKIYYGAGIYTVTLTVGTATYGSDSEIKLNYMAVSDSAAPTASFVADNTDKAGFTRNVTGDEFDFSGSTSTKQATTWTWDFSDGSTGTGQDVTHSFANPGTYSVALKAVTSQGVSAAVQDILIHQKTALDTYVRDTAVVPVPPFTYHNQLAGTGYTAYNYRLNSQYWRSGDYYDVDDQTDGLWQHWLTLVMPATMSGDSALLFISGGSSSSGAPTLGNTELQIVAMLSTFTQSPMALLSQIPNEPLEFLDEPGVSRNEDAIIAYTYDKYLDGGDESWPLLIPMVKGAVAAMDAAQSLSQTIAGHTINDFVVAGASKRGWTTWLTAAADTRVIGIAPLVIDVLNMDVQMDHHYSAYGAYSYAVQDYVEMNIFDRFDTPRGQALLGIVDPYSYLDRLTMPKLGINSTGDQFFLPDSAQFYFDDLVGDKHLRYLPNTDHSLSGSEYDVGLSLAAFYTGAAGGLSFPEVTWNVIAPGRMAVKTTGTPKEVNLWQATTNVGARDFRFGTIGAAWSSSTLTGSAGTYTAQVSDPGGNRWTGYFVELKFDSPLPGADYVFTTEVRVVPDTLPYPAP